MLARVKGHASDVIERARTADGDAWQAIGTLFRASGGGTAAVRGMRLMASGLPEAQYNAAAVTREDADIDGARAFYADLGVPWGMRVPAGMAWPHGSHVLHRRMMCLPASNARRRPAAPPGDVRLELARPADLEAVLAIDSAAYGSDPARTRPWLAALIGASNDLVAVARATRRSEPVGTGYAITAGIGALIGGIAVMPERRRLGIGTALTDWLVHRAFAAGAGLAVLEPDDDRAARLYARLGFVEIPGMDVYSG
jgi:GNAT superfamily N-acetyltransferase